LQSASGFVKAAHMTRTRNWISSGAVIAAAISGGAGCSRNDTPPLPQIPPITTPQPVDGAYHGLMQLIRGGEMSCGNSNEFTLQVSSQSFTYRLSQPQADWKPVVVFTATIGADGSFDAESGTSFMRGKLKDGHMHGQISGDICGFTFDADRTGTF